MSESRRPPRRGRGRRPSNRTGSDTGDNPYRDEAESAGSAPAATSEPETPPPVARAESDAAQPERPRRGRHPRSRKAGGEAAATSSAEGAAQPPNFEASPPPPPAAPAPSTM